MQIRVAQGEPPVDLETVSFPSGLCGWPSRGAIGARCRDASVREAWDHATAQTPESADRYVGAPGYDRVVGNDAGTAPLHGPEPLLRAAWAWGAEFIRRRVGELEAASGPERSKRKDGPREHSSGR